MRGLPHVQITTSAKMRSTGGPGGTEQKLWAQGEEERERGRAAQGGAGHQQEPVRPR